MFQEGGLQELGSKLNVEGGQQKSARLLGSARQRRLHMVEAGEWT